MAVNIAPRWGCRLGCRLGGTVSCVLRVSRVNMQAPWLCGANDYEQLLDRAAGLTPCRAALWDLLCDSPASLARLPV